MSCCLCHSDMTRRVHPFSSYRSCYFNTPGWGIPFQCWERTPPFTPAQLFPSLRPSVLALGFLPYPQLSTLGGICPPHPFNAAWRDLPPRCIVGGYLPLLPLHCPQNRARMLVFDGSWFLSITATLPPSKTSKHCSFSMEVYFFTY